MIQTDFSKYEGTPAQRIRRAIDAHEQVIREMWAESHRDPVIHDDYISLFATVDKHHQAIATLRDVLTLLEPNA